MQIQIQSRIIVFQKLQDRLHNQSITISTLEWIITYLHMWHYNLYTWLRPVEEDLAMSACLEHSGLKFLNLQTRDKIQVGGWGVNSDSLALGVRDWTHCAQSVHFKILKIIKFQTSQ
jgi:hypothetical protein